MLTSQPWLTLDELTAVAPTELPSHRIQRFSGEENPVLLDQLTPRDRESLREIYRILSSLFLQLRRTYEDPATCLETLRAFVRDKSDQGLITAAHSLGRGEPGDSSAHLDGLFHDLRGGALLGLVMQLEMIDYPGPHLTNIQQIFFLTRDHLKIMRNCVRDIDPILRDADSQRQDHSLDLLSEKWTSAHLGGSDSQLHVQVACHYTGIISESCLEFSTLDRIIYNMMNNAARFSADRTVQFTMLPIPAEQPANIRFIIANKVQPDQSATLRERFGDDLGALLHGGFTTGGHGLGLRICADFCAQAYGIPQLDNALRQGYFGARLERDIFLIWFHWPLRAE